MAAKKEASTEEEPSVPDHVEEPDNQPTNVDNAPHGRRVQGIN
jgi:hypothetical protein